MPTDSPMIRGILLVCGVASTPLLTTFEEVTENPPRELPESPAVSELVEETTLVDEIVVGVAKPTS